MTMHHFAVGSLAPVERSWDSTQFRFIFAICLPFYLVAATAARLKPNHWRETRRRSILSEAWEASGTTAGMALSG